MLGSNKNKTSENGQGPIRRMNRNDKILMRTCEWDGDNSLDLRLEDKVSLANVNAAFLQGLVVYVGKVHFAEGIWVGIQLTGPSIGRGSCNGVAQGKKYFADVGKNNGIMAPANKVSKRLKMKTGDDKVDEAQAKRTTEEARMADLEFIDALTQTRALAMLKISAEKQTMRFAGIFTKEETHITRLKHLRMAEMLRSRGAKPEPEYVNEPNLKYAPRDAPLQQCDLELAEGLEMTQQNYCLSDPTLPDNPITFASQAFLNMTGYNLNEILGKNCRFLQGDGTDDYAVYRVRLSIREGADCHVVLLNYRKDGTKFYNRLFMTALRDTKGRVKNYLGVQCQVSKEVAKRINKEEKGKLENKLKSVRVSATEDMSEHDAMSKSTRAVRVDGKAGKAKPRSRSSRMLLASEEKLGRRQSDGSIETPSSISSSPTSSSSSNTASSSPSPSPNELEALTEEDVCSFYNC